MAIDCRKGRDLKCQVIVEQLLGGFILLQKRRPLKSVRRILESASHQNLASALPAKSSESSPASFPKRQGSKKIRDEAAVLYGIGKSGSERALQESGAEPSQPLQGVEAA